MIELSTFKKLMEENDDRLPLLTLDELSGGSRFWNEDVELRVEDAVLEIQEMINSLEE